MYLLAARCRDERHGPASAFTFSQMRQPDPADLPDRLPDEPDHPEQQMRPDDDGGDADEQQC